MIDRNSPAKLNITTSNALAVKLHPYTQLSYRDNVYGFLRNFKLDFDSPRSGEATFSDSSYIPSYNWFLLFEEAEKEIMEDEYTFYGIRYETNVASAIKRLNKHLDDVESLIAKTQVETTENKDFVRGRRFSLRDEIVDMKKVLSKFDPKDKITMDFVFTEWPNIEEAKRKDYVHEFEQKVKQLEKREHCPGLPF